MTLSPSKPLGTRFAIVTGEWVHYQLAPVCAVPGCWERAEPGSHHICRRSDTAGPKNWVAIDGLVVPNRCRLCTSHHRAVTGGVGGHQARIVWAIDGPGRWLWAVHPPLTPAGSTYANMFEDDTGAWVVTGSLKGIEGMYSEEEVEFD